MGSEQWPLVPGAWERHLHQNGAERGGVRRVADRLLPEQELIVPPSGRRLSVPRSCRDNCRRKHRGFCVTADADIADRVACCMAHLRRLEKPEAIGTVLRFHATGCKEDHMHYSFAALRQSPKYAAMYIECVPQGTESEEDFYYLADVISYVGQVPKHRGSTPGHKSLTVVRSWQLAVLLCRRWPAFSVTMERLRFTVTMRLNTLHVTGSELLAADVTALPPDDDDANSARSRPRANKGVDALAKLAQPQHVAKTADIADAAVVDESRRRRLQKVLGIVGGAIAAPPADGEDGGSEPWWVNNLVAAAKAKPKPKRQRSPAVGPAGVDSNVDEMDLPDSAEEDDKWYVQKVGSLRDQAEAAQRMRQVSRRRRLRSRQQPAAARRESHAAPAQPGPSIAAAPAALAPAAPPTARPLERYLRGEPWGAQGRFVLAPVYARGVLTACTATCRLHVADGKRCNQSLSLGVSFTYAQAEHRIKQWLVAGLSIPDVPGGKDEHMRVRPRRWADAELMQLATLDEQAHASI